MTTTERVPLPTPLSKRYLRYLLGFGVSFVIGLAPFLGKVKVPGFSALIEMYPYEMQDWLIPLSGMLMGMMAVTVEYADQRVAQRRLDRWFVRTVTLFVVSLLALLVLYLFTVTRIGKTAASGERVSIAVVTGAVEVPAARKGCTCEPGTPAEECVAGTSLDPANIRRCFGPTRVTLATLGLALLYFILTGALAAGVGLLLLSQRRKKRPSPATIAS